MNLEQAVQNKLDNLTKPQGALGQLENIAKQVALIQKTASPKIDKTIVAIFAADHGLAEAGVSAFPQEVTGQMVQNFLAGGAAINVFSKQARADFELIDCGIKVEPEDHALLTKLRIAAGTKNMLQEPAMSQSQFQQCLKNGETLFERWQLQGYQLVALGEMGIGNTSSAAMLMSILLELPLTDCVGRGTGHNDEGLKKKLNILGQVKEQFASLNSPSDIGATVSGFEIATMTGVILASINSSVTLVIDGFIVTSAVLLAQRINSDAINNLIFSHQSDEAGHKKMLSALNAEPILKLGLRLGEGSGAALVIPLIRSAVAMLNEMASFSSAGVSTQAE